MREKSSTALKCIAEQVKRLADNHTFPIHLLTLTFSLVDHYTTFGSVAITLLNSGGELTTVKVQLFFNTYTVMQNTVGAKSLGTPIQFNK